MPKIARMVAGLLTSRASVGSLAIWSVLAFAIAGALFGRGISHSSAYLNDSIVFFDGMHRIAHGQIPNQDFRSPIGPLTYVLPYFGMRATGSYSGAIEMASLFLAVLALPAAAALLWRKTTNAAAILIFGTLIGVLVIPQIPGQSVSEMTNAMHYNRWGWGLLLVVFLLGLQPLEHTRWAAVCGAITGTVLFLLFLIKITYFLVGAVFLVLLLGILDARRVSAFVALGTFGSFMLLLLAVYPHVAFGYIDSIREALAADTAKRGSYTAIVRDNFATLFFLALAVFAAFLRSGVRWREWALCAFIAASGIAIIDQNYQWHFIVSIPAAFVILASIPPKDGKSDSLALVIVAGGLFSILPYLDDWARTAKAYALPPTSLTKTFVQTPQLAGLYVYDKGEFRSGGQIFHDGPVVLQDLLHGQVDTLPLSHFEYVDSLENGAELLLSSASGPGDVLTLDFTNSIPFMSGTNRSAGGYSWLHFGRNVSADTLPDGDTFFDGIQYVMVPLSSMTGQSTVELLKIYGDYLNQNSTEVAQSKYWVLLELKSRSNNE